MILRRALAALTLSILLTAAAAAADGTVLTVRTTDGLTVLHGAREDIDKAQLVAASAFPAGASNAQLAAFLASSPFAPQIAFEQYLSFAGVAAAGASVSLETTVRDAVRAGIVPAIENKPLHEAYMLTKMRGDTFMLIGEPPENAPGAGRSVFVFSSTWGTGLDGIFVDGADISPQKIGYNVVALAPDGSQIAAQGFETFNDPASGDKMQRFIESLPEGSTILVSVKVGPGVFLTGGAVQALRSYGSTTAPDTQVLSSDALIGSKSPGSAIEQSFVNGAASAILFDGSLYVRPGAQASLQPPPPGSRIVAIAGTKPDDAVFIFGPK